MSEYDEDSKKTRSDEREDDQSGPGSPAPLRPAAARLSTRLILLAAAVEGGGVALVILSPSVGQDVWRAFLFVALPVVGAVLGWYVPSLPAQYRLVLGALLIGIAIAPVLIYQTRAVNLGEFVTTPLRGPLPVRAILTSASVFGAVGLIPFFLAWFLRSSR